MVAKLLKQAFDNFHPIPVSVWESLADAGEIVFVKKETTIKKQDRAESHLNFIIKGSAGILLWSKNNFICTDMMFDNEFACDYLSFITRSSTPNEVVVFEDTELFRISHDALQGFTNQNEYGDKIWRYATQALYIDKYYQQLQLLTLTAAERYELMLQFQPFVIQRVAQKYIASYLGITPQSLSRMRNMKRK